MSDQPPPPPPHGGQNGGPKSGGLPPGKYDIFVIPEHSAGSGFLYLPSLQPNINSFVAGFASALVLVALGQSMAPAFRNWWDSFQGLGNMAIVMLIIGVGFGAWALGRTQKDGDPGFTSGFKPKPSASGGAGGYAGARPGAGPHADAPPPPPPHSEQGGPHSGQNGGPPPHGTRQHDDGYYPTGNTPPPHQGARAPPPPKPEPKKEPPPKSAWEKARDQYKGSWEKAREETRKKEEERKAKEAEQKRKEETAKRLAELRAKEAKERQAREVEKQKREKEVKDKEEKQKAEQRAKELSEKMERERKAREEQKKKDEEASKKAGSGYAYSGVGEKMSMWPNGKPPVPQHKSTPSTASSPSKKPPAPTAKTYMSEETHSYRPYDKPKSSRKKSVSSYAESDFSWAPSQTTNRTSPPPSMRGPYSTKDPDKIMISAVYLFMNQFSKTPASQLISGIGAVTDGLILRITTEGLFIDDDARGVPQREWDVKAWTLKQVEAGEWRSKGLHILRATLRDQEAKRYLFIIDEAEAWKMNLGLKRLKGGAQARQLGVSGMTGAEARGTLESLGWDT